MNTPTGDAATVYMTMVSLPGLALVLKPIVAGTSPKVLSAINAAFWSASFLSF